MNEKETPLDVSRWTGQLLKCEAWPRFKQHIEEKAESCMIAAMKEEASHEERAKLAAKFNVLAAMSVEIETMHANAKKLIDTEEKERKARESGKTSAWGV